MKTALFSIEYNLMNKLRHGDRSAFEHIYQIYNYELIGYLIKLLKSKELAQEVVQDTFIALWDNRSTVKVDSPIGPYLYTIAKNKSYNLLKRAAHDQKYREYLYPILEAGYEQIESNLYRKEQMALLEDIIAKMPERQRQIFILCKMEGKTYEEVANELELSIHTIHTQIKRSNQFIKNTLINYPEFVVAVIFLQSIPLL